MIETPEQEPGSRPYVTYRDLVFKKDEVVLGRYRVVRELGRGGMGIVYLCRDQIADVDVAVKGLPPEVSRSSDAMEDILHNYQLVRNLRDENIAAVTNLERDERTNDYYIVMDYVAGISLKRWMLEHPGLGSWRQKVAILRQVASALDYAHRAQPRHIIHRDVKPSNVIVGEGESVKVLDFGLAAQIRSSLSRRVSREVTSRSGTPSYKSPEQWQAQPQREASDQYSLGVIAYQMLADDLPFDDGDPNVLREAVIHNPVPPVPGLSPHVNAVLSKVLAKSAGDRYASCLAFVDALEESLGRGDDFASAAPPPSDVSASSEEQEFVLPETTLPSETSEWKGTDICLPDLPPEQALSKPLQPQELREIRCLCDDHYRTLLAESAVIHQKHGDDQTRKLLNRLQEMVRIAVPSEGKPGDPNELIRIFVLVGREYRKFLRKRADYSYFMEHRRRALLFQKDRVSRNAVTVALFASIG